MEKVSYKTVTQKEEMEKQNVVRRVLMLSEEESTLMHILENTATEHGTYDIESLFPVGTRYVELISVDQQRERIASGHQTEGCKCHTIKIKED